MTTDRRKSSLSPAVESEEHEFFSRFDKPGIARTVCAFLNGKGGRVVIGSTNTGNVGGLDDSIATEQLASYLRDTVLPVAAWSVNAEKANDGNSIVVIDVPSGTSKPYLINGQIWYRHGGNTEAATPDDVSQIIKDRIRADERWERRAALGVTENDLDLKEILSTAKDIQAGGRHNFSNDSDPLSVLNELGLLAGGQFSNAAVVLFGTFPTAIFSQVAARVTMFESDKKGKELIFDEILKGHLFSTLDRTLEIVRSKVGVFSEFHDDEVQRSDRPVYPFWSLREGLLNALVHRDLTEPSESMSVGIYPDCITIWNRGALPQGWKLSDLTKDHPSFPRNPDIAHVCFLRGMIEKLGRGTQLIADELKRFGLQKPAWQSGPTGTTLTFFNKRKSREIAQHSLNQRQHSVLNKLKSGERLTVASYLELCGDNAVSDRSARTDLIGLRDAGLLKRQGQGKNTFYVRTDRNVER